MPAYKRYALLEECPICSQKCSFWRENSAFQYICHLAELSMPNAIASDHPSINSSSTQHPTPQRGFQKLRVKTVHLSNLFEKLIFTWTFRSHTNMPFSATLPAGLSRITPWMQTRDNMAANALVTAPSSVKSQTVGRIVLKYCSTKFRWYGAPLNSSRGEPTSGYFTRIVSS